MLRLQIPQRKRRMAGRTDADNGWARRADSREPQAKMRPRQHSALRRAGPRAARQEVASIGVLAVPSYLRPLSIVRFMPRNATIYIVDDDEAIRDSLRLLLESAGFTNVVAYQSGRRFLAEAKPGPDACLLLDVRMPEMDGLELQTALNQRGSRLPVIIMTGHGDVPIAVRAMKAGAADFIEKPFSDDELLAALRRAVARGAEVNRELEQASETLRCLETLTAREREVFDGIVSGQPNKVIAHDLGISPRTVEIHRAHVMDKMKAHNASALVRMAMAANVQPNRR